MSDLTDREIDALKRRHRRETGNLRPSEAASYQRLVRLKRRYGGDLEGALGKAHRKVLDLAELIRRRDAGGPLIREPSGPKQSESSKESNK